jgi:phosphotransferase system HPr (HPr) family protein
MSPRKPKKPPSEPISEPEFNDTPATAIARLVQVVNPRGLHTRAAVALSRLAAGFDARIWIHHRNASVSARSISALLMLGAPLGDQALVVARGAEATEAVDAIERFFASGFDGVRDVDA